MWNLKRNDTNELIYKRENRHADLREQTYGCQEEQCGEGIAREFGMDVCVCILSHLSRVRLCVTPWTEARQAPLSMGFSRQEYWSGLPIPPPGDLPDPGIEPTSLISPALAGRSFTTSATWEALGMGVYTPLNLNWVTNKDHCISTGNPARCHVAAWMGAGVWRRMDTCICMAESLCCPPETTTLLTGYTPK